MADRLAKMHMKVLMLKSQSCDCMTKTNDPEFHSSICKYAILCSLENDVRTLMEEKDA